METYLFVDGLLRREVLAVTYLIGERRLSVERSCHVTRRRRTGWLWHGGLERGAVLANPLDPFTRPFLEHVHLAGRATGIEITPVVMARAPDEVEAAFATMAKERAEAVVVQGIFFSRTVADLAVKHGLPSASVLRQFAQVGGLISYGADVPDIFRRCASSYTRFCRARDLQSCPSSFRRSLSL